jgi:hypothetical protein
MTQRLVHKPVALARSASAPTCQQAAGEPRRVEISPEWRKELNRRLRDIDEGRANLIPHDQVRGSSAIGGVSVVFARRD